MERDPLREKLDAQEWADIYPRLYDFALYRARSKALAKDLVQGAIAAVYAYDSKWDPEKEPVLLRFLMSVMNSRLANERTSAAAQRNVSIDRARASAERVRDESAITEQRAVDGDLFVRRLALLKERLAGDAQALRVLDLALEGFDAPADVAAATGWSANVVAAVRLRFQRSAAKVARDLGAGDANAGDDADDRDDMPVVMHGDGKDDTYDREAESAQ